MKVTATAQTARLQVGSCPDYQELKACSRPGLRPSSTPGRVTLQLAGGGPPEAQRRRAPGLGVCSSRAAPCTLGGGHAKDRLWVRAWALWVAGSLWPTGNEVTELSLCKGSVMT